MFTVIGLNARGRYKCEKLWLHLLELPLSQRRQSFLTLGEKSTLEKKHRVETGHLFSPVYDLSPPPARDLIALQLATPPVGWAQVPIPRPKPKRFKTPDSD